MRSLITGITGFAGSHLAELLLKEGHEVHGLCRWRSKKENIEGILDKIHLHTADIKDQSSLQEVLKKVKPSFIFHLAALSFVQDSWKFPVETIQLNIGGTVNLLEAIRFSDLDCTTQFACSSEEYGFVLPEEVPIKETNPLRPISPYGVSKVGTENLAYQYYKSYGIKTIITRGFNHTGPRRGEVFATSSFAKQIALIEKGKQEPTLKVGNLSAKRDFTDVRDMVLGYFLSVTKCNFGEPYNISRGEAISIEDMLAMLLSMSTSKEIQVVPDPERMRPSDVEILWGDSTKFRKATGWSNRYSLETTLYDLLEYWRERV